jgi:hypothetical protein
MNDSYIPPGADHYWGADLDLPDTRDDPPEDDHQITDEQRVLKIAGFAHLRGAVMCRSMRRAIVREAKRRNLPVWAFLLLLEVTHD